jgi:hypothetical protein
MKINLLSPGDGNVLGEKDLLFNWEVENGSLQDCRFVVANSPQIQKGTIIYQEGTSDRNIANVSKTLFTAGKTYYWAVTGNDENGRPIWSPVWSFTLKSNDTGPIAGELKASVYLNPGKSDEIRIAIDPETEGKIIVRLTDINGALLAAKEIYSENGLPVTVSFSGLSLPAGIYLAVITTEEERVVRKVVAR